MGPSAVRPQASGRPGIEAFRRMRLDHPLTRMRVRGGGTPAPEWAGVRGGCLGRELLRGPLATRRGARPSTGGMGSLEDSGRVEVLRSAEARLTVDSTSPGANIAPPALRWEHTCRGSVREDGCHMSGMAISADLASAGPAGIDPELLTERGVEPPEGFDPRTIGVHERGSGSIRSASGARPGPSPPRTGRGRASPAGPPRRPGRPRRRRSIGGAGRGPGDDPAPEAAPGTPADESERSRARAGGPECLQGVGEGERDALDRRPDEVGTTGGVGQPEDDASRMGVVVGRPLAGEVGQDGQGEGRSGPASASSSSRPSRPRRAARRRRRGRWHR